MNDRKLNIDKEVPRTINEDKRDNIDHTALLLGFPTNHAVILFYFMYFYLFCELGGGGIQGTNDICLFTYYKLSFQVLACGFFRSFFQLLAAFFPFALNFLCFTVYPSTFAFVVMVKYAEKISLAKVPYPSRFSGTFTSRGHTQEQGVERLAA